MKFVELGFAGIVVAMSAIPTFAHHSLAIFDAEKKVIVEGTIKEFRWTNPHSRILMTVSNAQGQSQQWAIELGGPSALAKEGWVPKTLTPGMKIQAVIRPLRDGTPGGQLMAVTLPDGTTRSLYGTDRPSILREINVEKDDWRASRSRSAATSMR